MSASTTVAITVRLVGLPGPGTGAVSQAEPPIVGQGLPGNLVFDTSTSPAIVWLNVGGAWTAIGVLGGGPGGSSFIKFTVAGVPLTIAGVPLGVS